MTTITCKERATGPTLTTTPHKCYCHFWNLVGAQRTCDTSPQFVLLGGDVYTDRTTQNSVYLYGQGQAGFSVHMPRVSPSKYSRYISDQASRKGKKWFWVLQVFLTGMERRFCLKTTRKALRWRVG
jgi:hypothetical protein